MNQYRLYKNNIYNLEVHLRLMWKRRKNREHRSVGININKLLTPNVELLKNFIRLCFRVLFKSHEYCHEKHCPLWVFHEHGLKLMLANLLLSLMFFLQLTLRRSRIPSEICIQSNDAHH